MKTLTKYLNEKLIINKNYNYVGLDEIYNFDWKYYDRAGGIYYTDEDRKAFDVFYKYFIQRAKQKITFHQQCRLVNKGEYLFAVNESEKKIYLFHRHMNLDVKPSLYEKFEILHSHDRTLSVLLFLLFVFVRGFLTGNFVLVMVFVLW